MSRLDDIKAGRITHNDMPWLIGEVERLTAEADHVATCHQNYVANLDESRAALTAENAARRIPWTDFQIDQALSQLTAVHLARSSGDLRPLVGPASDDTVAIAIDALRACRTAAGVVVSEREPAKQ